MPKTEYLSDEIINAIKKYMQDEERPLLYIARKIKLPYPTLFDLYYKRRKGQAATIAKITDWLIQHHLIESTSIK